MEKRMMSAYVDVELHKKRKEKGISWENVIKRGLEDMDNSLAMNERFNILFETKIRPQIKEMQKRIFDLEQENEKYLERIISLKDERVD